MVQYDLTHLTQDDSQKVAGPIQDDEALFLFAIIRGRRLTRILEIGGLSGYSARNFIAALPSEGVLYTVDTKPVSLVHKTKHRVIQKSAEHLTAEDFEDLPLHMVFFDCHSYKAQIRMFKKLRREGIINDKTVLALHDTNTHPRKSFWWSYHTEDGWVHQTAERRMVNTFKKMGYDIFSLHTDADVHNEQFPYRHGVSIATRFKPLAVRRISRFLHFWPKRGQ